MYEQSMLGGVNVEIGRASCREKKKKQTTHKKKKKKKKRRKERQGIHLQKSLQRKIPEDR